MKKTLLIAAMVLVGMAVNAQNVIVVNSGKVFESMAAFKAAETELETLGKTRQAEIDAAFAQVETMYNSYMQQKSVLGEAARAQQEKAIIDRETAATERQEEIFGPDGELMKRRETLMNPIEERVKNAVTGYAQRVGATVVLEADGALYFNPAADRTQEIINLLK